MVLLLFVVVVVVVVGVGVVVVVVVVVVAVVVAVVVVVVFVVVGVGGGIRVIIQNDWPGNLNRPIKSTMFVEEIISKWIYNLYVDVISYYYDVRVNNNNDNTKVNIIHLQKYTFGNQLPPTWFLPRHW